ncbi:transposase [Streptacidiphilus sp. 4-A2]|nr:transposase [Streptacidiphilus sp. 4-A2]
MAEPSLPIGRPCRYPQRLREQFEGVIWKFRSGGQWREMPQEFGARQTAYDRFAQWRAGGVFAALMAPAGCISRRTGAVARWRSCSRRSRLPTAAGS